MCSFKDLKTNNLILHPSETEISQNLEMNCPVFHVDKAPEMRELWVDYDFSVVNI